MEESMSKKDKALFNWGLMDAIWNCDHKNAMEIVKTGIDLNFQNENGYTPVHALTYMHKRKRQPTDYELMKMMLDRGANPDTPSYDGDYPLQALAAGKYFDDIFKLILEYKPNVYQDFGHASCKLICENYPEIDQLLRDKGLIETDVAKMNMYQLAEEGTLEEFKRRYTGDMLDKRDSCGDKLITYALHGKKWETVYFLLQQSDKIDQEINSLGIDYAISHVISSKIPSDLNEMTKETRRYTDTQKEIIKYYVEHGADLNASHTLVSAISGIDIITDDEIELINYLIDHGAELTDIAFEVIQECCIPAYELIKKRGVKIVKY